MIIKHKIKNKAYTYREKYVYAFVVLFGLFVLFNAEKPVNADAEHLCNCNKLKIRNISELTFKLGKTGSVEVDTVNLQLGK